MNTESHFDPLPFTSSHFSQPQILSLKRVFDILDEEGAGIILPRNLEGHLKRQGIEMSRECLYQILEEYDQHEIGGITFRQFLEMIRYNPREREGKKEVRKVFEKYDKEKKGYITQGDIERMATKLDHFKEGLEIGGLTVGDKITFEEFYELMMQGEDVITNK